MILVMKMQKIVSIIRSFILYIEYEQFFVRKNREPFNKENNILLLNNYEMALCLFEKIINMLPTKEDYTYICKYIISEMIYHPNNLITPPKTIRIFDIDVGYTLFERFTGLYKCRYMNLLPPNFNDGEDDKEKQLTIIFEVICKKKIENVVLYIEVRKELI